MKIFTAISTDIEDDKVLRINSSNGQSRFNPSGLHIDDILGFFWQLRLKKKEHEYFVCYAFQADNEVIFSQLPKELRDKLFQSYKIRRDVQQLTEESDELEYLRFNLDKESQKYQEVDFNLYVNKQFLNDAVEVIYNDFKLRLINGKLLSLSKAGKQLIIYDVYGFFRKPLEDVYIKWISESDRRETKTNRSVPEKQLLRVPIEVAKIKQIMTKFNTDLEKNGIQLKSFFSSSISNYVLSQSKARTEYNSYKTKRQYSAELYKATHQAYYGGRVEQFKIGTFNQEVNVYDINSAYGYAILNLPKIKSKPTFTRTYDAAEPFAMWYCEFDFTGINSYFGYLPTRTVNGFIQYQQCGRGYYWSPEVDFVTKHFPQCVKVLHGFVFDYVRANFVSVIADLYQLRQKLIAENNPLEKVIKLAIAGIYGKFKQEIGKNHYHNLFYSGYTTSHCSKQLLESTVNNECNIICFMVDAIHTTNALQQVKVSNELGEWKQETYSKAVYLDNGIYRLYKDGEAVKTKTKGFRAFDFDRCLQELQDKRTYNAIVEFFVGHNLYSFMPIAGNEYLRTHSKTQQNNPLAITNRLYESVGIDLTKTHCDSSILSEYAGRESMQYAQSPFRASDLNRDSVTAGRV